jgi:hypothetical protein
MYLIYVEYVKNMVATSSIRFNLGSYTVSFDTGIVDDYDEKELTPVNLERKDETPKGIITTKYTIYKAIVTNKAKDDCAFVQLWKYDRLMSIEEKRKLYEDSTLSIPLQGNWQSSTHPYLIAGMEGLVGQLKPPEKRDYINLGTHCKAKLRDDYVYVGSYWPDEKHRHFSVWCSLISTYPWVGGAKDILDSLEVRITT